MNNYTISGIANLIKQMELDLGLLQDETYGLDARYVWEGTRYKLHLYLNERLLSHDNNYKKARPNNRKLWHRICRGGKNVYSIFVKNWLWAPKGRDWLIIRDNRSQKISGKKYYENIYTDELIDEIGANKCVIIERSYERWHYPSEKHKVFHHEFFVLYSGIVSKLFNIKYDFASISKMMHDIQSYIESKLEQKELRLEKVFAVKSSFAIYMGWLFMLKWLKPKKILIVMYRSYGQLVKAALTMHIPTVGLQHNAITSENLLFSMANGTTSKYFPDYLLLFGNFWKETVDNFPLPPERLIIFGFPYIQKMFRENNSSNQKENQIVILSQPRIRNELSKFTVKLALFTKDNYKVIYKLHPVEMNNAPLLYPELYEAQEKGLLDVVDTDTPTLHMLFSQSRWQIGVSSTALYEGLAFGCQLILVDLPGVESMVPLIKKGYAQLVKTPEEIQFTQNKNTIDIREDLFASNWRSNWQQFAQMNLTCRY